MLTVCRLLSARLSLLSVGLLAVGLLRLRLLLGCSVRWLTLRLLLRSPVCLLLLLAYCVKINRERIGKKKQLEQLFIVENGMKQKTLHKTKNYRIVAEEHAATAADRIVAAGRTLTNT